MTPKAAAVTLSESMRVSWPVMVTIIVATAWLTRELADIRGSLKQLVLIAADHQAKIERLQELSAARGPRIEALERARGQ